MLVRPDMIHQSQNVLVNRRSLVRSYRSVANLYAAPLEACIFKSNGYLQDSRWTLSGTAFELDQTYWKLPWLKDLCIPSLSDTATQRKQELLAWTQMWSKNRYRRSWSTLVTSKLNFLIRVQNLIHGRPLSVRMWVVYSVYCLGRANF